MALTGSTNEEKIWNYLIASGLNEYGAAGLMGNLYAESACDPSTVEMLLVQRYDEDKAKYPSVSYLKNWKRPVTEHRIENNKNYTELIDKKIINKTEFLKPRSYTGTKYQYGYGLAQWTSQGRKEALYNLIESRNVSISDLKTQLDWLLMELQNTYQSVYSVLKTAKSVKEASDIVLVKYESPSDANSMKATRASYGQKYYDKFAGKATSSAQEPILVGKKQITKQEAVNYTKTLLKHYPFVYCPTLAGFTTNKTPHKGDIVLFYKGGTFTHTGYVYNVSGSTYYTIEGNTSGASGVIANGGGVCKKSYSTSSYPGTKFFRPDYSILVSAGLFKDTTTAINSIIATAEQEVGYLEKKSNSNLDSKTGNAGSNNYTKYWRDVYPAYQAQAWCACFVTWIIQYTLMGTSAGAVTTQPTAQPASPQSTINETEKFKGIIKETAKIRKYAGTSYDECSFSPLPAGTAISVCDMVKASKGADWYYIRYNNKTGFVSAKYVEKEGIITNAPSKSTEYMVKVTTDALNIRGGAGTNFPIKGVIKDQGTYTIVETSGDWGRLKSGAGWISLKYVKKV